MNQNIDVIKWHAYVFVFVLNIIQYANEIIKFYKLLLLNIHFIL